MGTTRPAVQQLGQSGATVGQVLVWDGTTWAPGSGSGLSACRAAFTATGGERVIYLNATPLTSSEAVFINGLRKSWTTDYTLSGTVITLTSALTAGQVLLVDYLTTGVCGIAGLGPIPTGFTRPGLPPRTPRRFHRIR